MSLSEGSELPGAGGLSAMTTSEALVRAQMLCDYFQGSGMSLQEYFKFPEMKQIRNPVHEYFRLAGSDGNAVGQSHWIEEGTLPIEEGEDGWVFLGAEHQELARIAVGRSRNRQYLAVAWGDSYLGPVLRTTWGLLSASASLATGTVRVTGAVLGSVASVIYRPPPGIPRADVPYEDRFVEESVEVDGETWYFRVWLPLDLGAIRKENGGLPAFLLLHGFKECGWDNWWQTKSGLASLLSTHPRWVEWFPGILVMPQLPRRPHDEDWWQHWRQPSMQRMALACLEKAVAKYGADRRRLYLLGESLGTEGAWYLAASQPGKFAAVGGACGSVEPYNWRSWEWGSEPESYMRLAEGIGRVTPMWFCHGAEDSFVPLEQSRRLYDALLQSRMPSAVGAILGRSEAGEVVFKEYEDLDHHVWDRAYWDDCLIQWMMSHTKP